jgi:hypothetical protein
MGRNEAITAFGAQTLDAKQESILDRVAERRSANNPNGLSSVLSVLGDLALVLGNFLLLSVPFQVFFFATKFFLPAVLVDVSLPDRIVAYIGVVYAAWLGIRFLLPAQKDLRRLRGTRNENAPYVRFSDMTAMVALRRSRFICEVKQFLRRVHA